MNQVRLILELPVERSKEYRMWPEGVVRLFLFDRYATNQETRSTSFSRWVVELLEGATLKTYAHPIECWFSDKKMRRFLETGPFLRDWVRVEESYWFIPCPSRESIGYLMQTNAFNQVVFFSAREVELALRIVTEAGIRDQREDNRFDTPFLRFCTSVGGFIFYSYTHDNLELLGNYQFIVNRCFRPFWKQWDLEAGGGDHLLA